MEMLQRARLIGKKEGFKIGPSFARCELVGTAQQRYDKIRDEPFWKNTEGSSGMEARSSKQYHTNTTSHFRVSIGTDRFFRFVRQSGH